MRAMDSSSPPSTATLDLGVGGMTCASCVARVERAVRKVPGVSDATVNLATESARITYAPGAQVEAQIRRAVRNAGYEPRAPEQAFEAEASRWAGFARSRPDSCCRCRSSRRCWASVLGLHAMLPAWLQFALATPVQFGLGARFYRAGWNALRAGTGNMDLLVALGTARRMASVVYALAPTGTRRTCTSRPPRS